MKLEIRISLTNGGDSETAPRIVFANFNYNAGVATNKEYLNLLTAAIDAIKEPSS